MKCLVFICLVFKRHGFVLNMWSNVNEFTQAEVRPVEGLATFLQVLNPFAPHVTEELYARLRERFPAELPEGLLCDAPWPEFDEEHFLVMATKSGQIKKTALAAYTNATRESGLIGINLAEGDNVIGCVLTDGSDEIILVSHQGLAVRFREKNP